jgi:hypothetical protein
MKGFHTFIAQEFHSRDVQFQHSDRIAGRDLVQLEIARAYPKALRAFANFSPRPCP